MKIVQSLNQNAVLVKNENNEEMILTGRGIGYKKKPGDSVDNDKISQIYRFDYSTEQKEIVDSIKNIPPNIILIAEEVLSAVKKQFSIQFDSTSIFLFASHLYHAIERSKNHDVDKAVLEYEFKHIFPKEYQASEYALSFLNKKHNIHLPNFEKSFFTMHFLNASSSTETLSDVLLVSEIISDILNIVNKFLSPNLDKNNVFYSRFITHLRYFLFRKLNTTRQMHSELENLFDYIATNYSVATEICHKTVELLQSKYSINVEKIEQLYLIIHLQRLIDETKNDDF